jgi:hexosaminidase
MVMRHLVLALAVLGGPAAAADDGIRLVPQPASVVRGAGDLVLARKAKISVPVADVGAAKAADVLIDLTRKSSSRRLTRSTGDGQVRFVRSTGFEPEAYRLEVDGAHATITASSDAGLLYGGVTLWQLANGTDTIPAVKIDDAPRFGWRGMMLDSARNFQSPAFIRRLIDAMAAHKLNRLHWHLVDDQGWRIEIPKYPRLTTVGAWRRPAAAPGAPLLPMVGGFYTQSEIRQIVRYAAVRNVTIVPEIEMPGHALSAIRAYPWLGTGGSVKPGIESDWGVFDAIYNVDERTFGFLEDVLSDVVSLFPSTYIHVGGDEAVKDRWRTSPEVQARMKTLGLSNENALQGWFVNRIERYLASRGRKLVGWDEILDGGVPSGAVVMSWRGIDGALAAARTGHDTVLAASPTLYLDHLQGHSLSEGPGRGGVVSLADVYAFDPAPAALSAEQREHILGLQANLWTEHVRGESRAAYMAFPRASAVAELGWSSRQSHDFASFVGRLVPQLERLKSLGIGPAFSAFAPLIEQRLRSDDTIAVTASNQLGLPMRYTLDDREPTIASKPITTPLALSPGTHIRVASFIEGKATGPVVDAFVDTASARLRSDRALRSCNSGVPLALEDDAPAAGPRASFLLNILEPCWIYEKAALDKVTAIRIQVGQLPFNFQIGKDIEKIVFRKPKSPAGEFEVRLDRCDGPVVATLPLAPAVHSAAKSTLTAVISPQRGDHDLCLTYTANGPHPLWAVQSVTLLTP